MNSFQLPAGLTGLLLICAARALTAQGESPAQGEGVGLPALKPPAVRLPEGFVRFVRVPEGGIQPSVEVSGDALSILYFKGDEAGGDLFLTRSRDEAKTFEPSVRVNVEPGDVLSQASGHSGTLGLGPDGRAHVLWVAGHEQPKLCYTRERAEGGLEPVQDLGSPERLCRSTAIAIDARGGVYAFYSAVDTDVDGETPGLRVWMRVSEDGGASFSAPVTIDQKPDGVAEGSGLAARIDRLGTLFVLYVTAGRHGGSEVRLLSRAEGGPKFISRVVELATRRDIDPRARPSLSPEWTPKPGAKFSYVFASWDTFGRVFWSGIDPEERGLGGRVPMTPKGDALSRRTRASFQASGSDFFLVWLEQPKGERDAPPVVAWQVWSAEGLLAVDWGRAPETAGASFPVAFANKARGFTVLY